MAEPQEDLTYLDHDAELLRELIKRGLESGRAEPLDFDEAIREAREELRTEREAR